MTTSGPATFRRSNVHIHAQKSSRPAPLVMWSGDIVVSMPHFCSFLPLPPSFLDPLRLSKCIIHRNVVFSRRFDYTVLERLRGGYGQPGPLTTRHWEIYFKNLPAPGLWPALIGRAKCWLSMRAPIGRYYCASYTQRTGPHNNMNNFTSHSSQNKSKCLNKFSSHILYWPVMLSHFSPAPRENRSGDTNPINQSSHSDYKVLQWKSTLDWLILHISGKIVLRV